MQATIYVSSLYFHCPYKTILRNGCLHYHTCSLGGRKHRLKFIGNCLKDCLLEYGNILLPSCPSPDGIQHVPCWLDSHAMHNMSYLPNLPSREPWLHYILINLYFPTDLKFKNLHYVNLMKARTHAELIDSEGLGYVSEQRQTEVKS